MIQCQCNNFCDKFITLGKYNWQEGYVSGTVYYYNEELIDLIAQVCKLASYANPLHPDVFPGACKMEAEVIKMAVQIFHGGEDGCGVVIDYFECFHCKMMELISF